MSLEFDPRPQPDDIPALRREVRDFLAEEAAAGTFDPDDLDATSRFNRDFSRKVGARGWIGMTWPRELGGHGRSYLERYAVTEELLAGNAPIRAHFVADRQSGPMLIRHAAPDVRDRLLPQIMAGELCFCIGMSEPDSGSDLFAARAKAEAVEGGFRLNGRKVWTTLAHHADWMIGIFRTSAPTEENRRYGLTQFLIDMTSPGITVRPVLFPNGEHDFNEILFEDVFVPGDHVLGKVDDAWRQATSELAFERSGPERFLEAYPVLPALAAAAGADAHERMNEGLGRMAARLHVHRQMAMAIAHAMDHGAEPVAEASVVKAAATPWEQKITAEARELARFARGDEADQARLRDVLHHMTALVPKVTIQGGTTEILRGIVARALGLR